MEYLLIALYAYLIVGFFYLLLTSFMIFKSKKNHEHKVALTGKWSTLWNMPKIGKTLAVITILLSIGWLIIGWPEGIINGFKRLKNIKNEN